jgi:hypothetical protein
MSSVLIVAGDRDWWFESAKALAGLILGFLGGVAVEKYKKRDTRNARAAAHLEVIAAALEGIADCFELRKIPHKDGHLLEALLDTFTETMSSLVGDQMLSTLKRLNSLAQTAADIDDSILDAQNQKALNAWINDGRRVAGDLRGKAALLRAK